MSLLILTSV